MRKFMMMILACGGIAMGSHASFAQTEPQVAPAQQQMFCDERDGPLKCTPTTEQSYDHCANLAVARGWQSARGAGYDRFIYECLTGRIPQ
jgi:hypothetical protein